MHSIVTFYQSIPSSTWTVIAAALGLSGLLQALKHFFFSKLSAQALMALTTLFAFLGAAVQYADSAVKSNPTVLGQHTAALLGAMTLSYRYVVAPGYKLLLDAKSYRSTPATNSDAAQPAATASGEAAF
jgi:hypothetical protein